MECFDAIGKDFKMIEADTFVKLLGADFYVGVPDSQLKALCNFLLDTYGIDSRHHVIAANEGNCVALAAGHYLATGRPAVVYMQNSGEGNAVNPIASLLKVYGIPVILVIGWRGEPGVHDEPQHLYQGKMTLPLLDVLGIACCVVSDKSTKDEIMRQMEVFRETLQRGESVAFVIRKEALQYENKPKIKSIGQMKREDILRSILYAAKGDILVSTTGKTSREIFELREANGEDHAHDFLTVGSMGHSSSIALGVALAKPERRVWCIDGDGAVLMHMGAMAVIGAHKPKNLIHIVVNNGAHESVGGMPTVMRTVDLPLVARGCGYEYVARVETKEALERELAEARKQGRLSLLEVMSATGSRANLGRPTVTPADNMKTLMQEIN